MESFLNKEKKEQRKSKEGEKKKKERSFIPALLLLTEAQSFCLNCINYSVIFRLKIHQNSPYLASLHERSLKCQFQLPCLCSFAICVLAMLANLQPPIAISGFHDWNVPLLLQTRSVFLNAAVQPNSPHLCFSSVVCTSSTPSVWLPVALLSIINPFLDVLNLLAPTSSMCQ